MSDQRQTGRRDDSPPRGRRWATIDLLLIALYAVVAVLIVVGLILMIIWGAISD